MGIEIEQTQNMPPEPPKDTNISPPVPKEPDDTGMSTSDPIDAALQPILLKTGINTIGNLLAKFSKIEDMAFTDEESEALIQAWTPLLPKVSPMTNAVLVTLIIVSGKGAIYFAKRTKKPANQPNKPDDKTGATATLPPALPKGSSDIVAITAS